MFFKHQSFPYNRIITFPELKLHYMPISKNGNSFVKTVLLVNCESEAQFDPGHESSLQYIDRIGVKKFRIKRLKDLKNKQYYFFVVLRNPFERIVSAYLDKFVKKPPKYDPYLKSLGLRADADPSFRQFLSIVCNQKNKNYNNHWKPQSCFVQGIDFDGYYDLSRIEQLFLDIESLHGIRLKRFDQYRFHHSKATTYNSQTGQVKYENACASSFRDSQAYAGPENLFTSDLVDVFMKKYSQDVQLYCNLFGYQVDQLVSNVTEQ